MSTYSKALRHIDMKDVKQKHQQKLIEQKIQRRLEREERKYIQSVMKDRRVDWRKELNEQMTTSDMFFTTLPAYGDTNLASPAWSVFDGYQYSVNGGTLTLSGDPSPYPTNTAFSTFDTSLYDTLVFDVIVGAGSGFALFDVPATGPYLITSTSGTYSVSLPTSKSLSLAFLANGNGNATISNLRFQRRTPMNVFIALNSPEATSFIRSDPNLSDLSPKEKQQKLKEMLEASDEYVMNMFGGEFPGTGAVPPGESGDVPGVQITDYENDLTPLSDKPYGTEVGQIAGNPDTGGQPGYGSPTGFTNVPSQAERSNKNMTWDKHMQMWVPNLGIEKLKGV